ncbi:MAG TPA: amidohydrolase family protein, partial [Methanoregulaceae archaeon]|nr:amidohydrolase family protein [Methanoregulaceae archaeon]
GMRATLERMVRGGTTGCADFREGGVRGIELLRMAARDLPIRVVGLGRDGGEMVADGAGIASARDLSGYDEVVARVRARGGIIAFHAGEQDDGDVDPALDCHPDFVVHMTHATDRQLRRCADEGIPIAVCPRSNWRLGVSQGPHHPPITRMLDHGCRVLLGTDNAMFVSPDMASELMFTSFVYGTDAGLLLRAAIEGAAVIGLPSWIETGAWANFLVIDPARGGVGSSHDPVASLVRRLDSSMIETKVFTLKDESMKTIF